MTQFITKALVSYDALDVYPGDTLEFYYKVLFSLPGIPFTGKLDVYAGVAHLTSHTITEKTRAISGSGKFKIPATAKGSYTETIYFVFGIPGMGIKEIVSKQLHVKLSDRNVDDQKDKSIELSTVILKVKDHNSVSGWTVNPPSGSTLNLPSGKLDMNLIIAAKFADGTVIPEMNFTLLSRRKTLIDHKPMTKSGNTFTYSLNGLDVTTDEYYFVINVPGVTSDVSIYKLTLKVPVKPDSPVSELEISYSVNGISNPSSITLKSNTVSITLDVRAPSDITYRVKIFTDKSKEPIFVEKYVGDNTVEFSTNISEPTTFKVIVEAKTLNSEFKPVKTFTTKVSALQYTSSTNFPPLKMSKPVALGGIALLITAAVIYLLWRGKK